MARGRRRIRRPRLARSELLPAERLPVFLPAPAGVDREGLPAPVDSFIRLGAPQPHAQRDRPLQLRLAAQEVRTTETTQHIVGAFQHFDYINNWNLEFGAQSIGAGFLTRMQTKGGYDLRAAVHANAVLMAGVSSPYSGFTGREYDYGPGVGLHFEASFARNGWPWLSVRHDSYFINTVNGPDSEHLVTVNRVRAIAPLVNDIGLGLEYSFSYVENRYADYPDQKARTPQARIFASWGLD